MATVVIITPVYATHENGRIGLYEQTLASVVRQKSQRNIIHLTVDNGSTEDISMLVKDLDDPRFRFLRRKPATGELGTASNPINCGIECILSQPSELFTSKEANDIAAVAYLHSDDVLNIGSVEKRAANLNGGLVYADNALFDNKARILEINRRGPYTDGSHTAMSDFVDFPNHTLMWDIYFLRYALDFVKRRYENNHSGLFDPNFFIGEDTDATISSFEAAIRGKYPIRHLPFAGEFYRIHKQSIGRQQVGSFQSQWLAIYQKHLGQGLISEFERPKDPRPINPKLFGLYSSIAPYLPRPVKALLRPLKAAIKKSSGSPRYKNPIEFALLERNLLRAGARNTSD